MILISFIRGYTCRTRGRKQKSTFLQVLQLTYVIHHPSNSHPSTNTLFIQLYRSCSLLFISFSESSSSPSPSHTCCSKFIPGVESKLKAPLLSSSTWWQTTHIGSLPSLRGNPVLLIAHLVPVRRNWKHQPIFLCCCCRVLALFSPIQNLRLDIFVCVVLFSLLQSGTCGLRRAVVASDSIPGLGSGVFLGGGLLVVLDRELTRLRFPSLTSDYLIIFCSNGDEYWVRHFWFWFSGSVWVGRCSGGWVLGGVLEQFCSSV